MTSTTLHSRLSAVIAMSKSSDEMKTLLDLSVWERQKLRHEMVKMAQAIDCCSKPPRFTLRNKPELLDISVTDYTDGLEEECREHVIGKLLDMQQGLSETRCKEKQKELLLEVCSKIRENYSLDTDEREALYDLFRDLSESIGVSVDFE